MDAKITIVAEGADLDPAAATAALNEITEIKARPVGPSRGVMEGIGKAATWVAEFAGNTGKIVDALLKLAEKQLAGVSIKVQYGSTVIEVSNARRADLIALLDKTQRMAKEASAL